ncbi:MAG: hypothetical protein K1W01_01250 [Muribaculaceae bacterium]
MKKILLVLPLFTILLCCCSKGGVAFTKDYDSELCADLSTKIERHDSLTQQDYRNMIAQNEAILKYLIERTAAIGEQPDSCRYQSWRAMTAEPEYLERFGYMFTLGSALYRAELNGRLDEDNTEAYDELDDYNTRLADYTDHISG